MTSAGTDLFAQINNAVFDLQGSQLQTYERPLRTLARLLKDPALEAANYTLTNGVDLEQFLVKSEQSGGGMVGSHTLAWPDDHEQMLGLNLLLIDKLAAAPDQALNFGFQYFHTSGNAIAHIHSLTRQLIVPFVRDYRTYVESRGNIKPRLVTAATNRIFIVHGHDAEARESVARFLTTIGFDPVILHEQPNQGRTVIEKVEQHSDVGFVVVLLTPDDEGRSAKESSLAPRARQNVLIELGYFIGLLGRAKVCALKRGNVDVPSDFAGVVWEAMDGGGGWKQVLARELEAAGYSIDWNKVMKP